MGQFEWNTIGAVENKFQANTSVSSASFNGKVTIAYLDDKSGLNYSHSIDGLFNGNEKQTSLDVKAKLVNLVNIGKCLVLFYIDEKNFIHLIKSDSEGEFVLANSVNLGFNASYLSACVAGTNVYLVYQDSGSVYYATSDLEVKSFSQSTQIGHWEARCVSCVYYNNMLTICHTDPNHNGKIYIAHSSMKDGKFDGEAQKLHGWEAGSISFVPLNETLMMIHSDPNDGRVYIGSNSKGTFEDDDQDLYRAEGLNLFSTAFTSIGDSLVGYGIRTDENEKYIIQAAKLFLKRVDIICKTLTNTFPKAKLVTYMKLEHELILTNSDSLFKSIRSDLGDPAISYGTFDYDSIALDLKTRVAKYCMDNGYKWTASRVACGVAYGVHKDDVNNRHAFNFYVDWNGILQFFDPTGTDDQTPPKINNSGNDKASVNDYLIQGLLL